MFSVPHKSEGFCLAHSQATLVIPWTAFCIASLLKMLVCLRECNGDVKPALCLPNPISPCRFFKIYQLSLIITLHNKQPSDSVVSISNTHLLSHYRCGGSWVIFLRLQGCAGCVGNLTFLKKKLQNCERTQKYCSSEDHLLELGSVTPYPSHWVA